jgi:hypothetical protein
MNGAANAHKTSFRIWYWCIMGGEPEQRWTLCNARADALRNQKNCIGKILLTQIYLIGRSRAV